MLKPRKVGYGSGDVPLAKPRKTNFTAREVEVLLNSVRKHRDTVLFGVAGGQGWAQAWMEVAKVVSTVEGIVRTESDVRKKWTYLKWEAKNTSKPGRDPTSRAVLDILTSRNWEAKDSSSKAASAGGMSLLETLLGKDRMCARLTLQRCVSPSAAHVRLRTAHGSRIGQETQRSCSVVAGRTEQSHGLCWGGRGAHDQCDAMQLPTGVIPANKTALSLVFVGGRGIERSRARFQATLAVGLKHAVLWYVTQM
jgi:hypothetical protein